MNLESLMFLLKTENKLLKIKLKEKMKIKFKLNYIVWKYIL